MPLIDNHGAEVEWIPDLTCSSILSLAHRADRSTAFQLSQPHEEKKGDKVMLLHHVLQPDFSPTTTVEKNIKGRRRRAASVKMTRDDQWSE